MKIELPTAINENETIQAKLRRITQTTSVVASFAGRRDEDGMWIVSYEADEVVLRGFVISHFGQLVHDVTFDTPAPTL